MLTIFYIDTKKLEMSLFFAWAVSLIATLGSLYFSEIVHYIPCKLCWIQRIFMYPLAILLAIAIIRKDYQIYHYGLPLSIVGGCISLYHYSIQKISFLGEHSLSCGITPCTSQYINWFGFITIPFLALIAFTIITILQFIMMKQQRRY